MFTSGRTNQAAGLLAVVFDAGYAREACAPACLFEVTLARLLHAAARCRAALRPPQCALHALRAATLACPHMMRLLHPKSALRIPCMHMRARLFYTGLMHASLCF